MATQSQIPDSATASAPIPFPTRRRLPRRPDEREMDLAADLCREAEEARQELIHALRDALEAVEFAKQRSHPTLGEALDILTDGARATYARVQS